MTTTVDRFSPTSSAAGENADNHSEVVYGLFQCRNDVSSTVCSECVKDATQRIIKDCPVDREAIVWYFECMLRYANRNILSSTEKSPMIYFFNNVSMSNDMEFARIKEHTLNDTIKNASIALTHFVSSETNWTTVDTLYSFAQCTRDIASGSSKKTVGHIVAIAVCVPFALVVLLVFLWVRLFRKKTKGGSSGAPLASPRGLLDGSVNGDAYNFGEIEFMEYDLATLKNATRDFSHENVLGEGEFGIVYKGKLENGRPLAIKRLSVASGQSRDDFMSNVDLLAELRHSNLARLVGFCYEEDEKLLVYELMSNTSLDRFLFDPRKRPLLSWLTRHNIILGIAKGLQYLHEDPHLSIVHRRLKPNNILLDRDMNPKITDFGLEKLFDVGQEPRQNTSRIVRTKGYVAPENSSFGDHSLKSDVYSFGVMVLEIVSGQKNRLFNRSPNNEDLPIHAWKLWNDGRPFDLTDPALYNNCPSSDVIKCIQIGLLCVQANADERPSMQTVVRMLSGYVDLPLPSAPATSFHQFDTMSECYSDDQKSNPDQSAAKTVTWRTEFEQDLFPTGPR
ncbi:hypothetical protein KSS87_013335 [Heliosperma pusillum]|nr:hypothetical protein KSS87_013335 [Heliosperma pusillum]